MVMLQRWSVKWRENGHVMEVASLKEGEWSCYRGGQFREGERSRCRGSHLNGGRVVMLWWRPV